MTWPCTRFEPAVIRSQRLIHWATTCHHTTKGKLSVVQGKLVMSSTLTPPHSTYSGAIGLACPGRIKARRHGMAVTTPNGRLETTLFCFLDLIFFIWILKLWAGANICVSPNCWWAPPDATSLLLSWRRHWGWRRSILIVEHYLIWWSSCWWTLS